MEEKLIQLLYEEDIYKVKEKTTVIISQPWKDVAAEERTLLEKILSAVKLSLDAVAIIHQSSLDLSQFQQKPGKAIYFGPSVNGLALYEVLSVEDATSIVMSEPLHRIQNDAAAKQKLWQALKQLFSR